MFFFSSFSYISEVNEIDGLDDDYRFQRAKPIIIDPGLYMSKKADVFWVTQRRSVPTAFKLFTGKGKFVGICVLIVRDFAFCGDNHTERIIEGLSNILMYIYHYY